MGLMGLVGLTAGGDVGNLGTTWLATGFTTGCGLTGVIDFGLTYLTVWFNSGQSDSCSVVSPRSETDSVFDASDNRASLSSFFAFETGPLEGKAGGGAFFIGFIDNFEPVGFVGIVDAV